MTSFGYNERNLHVREHRKESENDAYRKKGDRLKLHCVDQDGNNLELQEFSNFWSVKYVGMVINED
ncbi:MAG: hypothetical protein LBD75_07135 [Candidatus Peribacteria bacterium]|jgi:hypothetical protein|nr:hypothetical protein [Candidatus Peribacteria bacterium]